MNLIANGLAHLAILLLLIYLFISLVNLIGLGIAFIPASNRRDNLEEVYREDMKGWRDWEIIAFMVIIAVIPYINLVVYPECRGEISAQLSKWKQALLKNRWIATFLHFFKRAA